MRIISTVWRKSFGRKKKYKKRKHKLPYLLPFSEALFDVDLDRESTAELFL